MHNFLLKVFDVHNGKNIYIYKHTYMNIYIYIYYISMRAEVVYVHAPSDELQKEMIRIASIVLLVKSNDSFYYKPSPMGDISCQLYIHTYSWKMKYTISLLFLCIAETGLCRHTLWRRKTKQRCIA